MSIFEDARARMTTLSALLAKLPERWQPEKRHAWLQATDGLTFGKLVKDGDPNYESDVLKQADNPHEAEVVNSILDVEGNHFLENGIVYPGRGLATRHKVLLDIDMPVLAVESSTPGHYHLYIDKELSWSEYHGLLEALKRCGIIEAGYYEASRRRGFTSLRTPWTPKPSRLAKDIHLKGEPLEYR